MSDTPPPSASPSSAGDKPHYQVWPFTVHTGCPVSDVSIPHLHDYYVVHLVLEGRGTHVVDFKEYAIEPNTLYFVSPRQLHMWCPDDDLKGYVLVFTEDFLVSSNFPGGCVGELEFFHSASHSPRLSITPEQAAALGEQLGRMRGEFERQEDGFLSVLRASFHIFMVHLQRMFAEELARTSARREHEMVRRFMELVSASYAEQMRIADYAERMNVSVSRLNEVVRNETGSTPSQLVRNERILAAKRLLVHSDMNVAEVCYALNFEDPSYFGRFFRRETGLSPAAFRKEVRDRYQPLAR